MTPHSPAKEKTPSADDAGTASSTPTGPIDRPVTIRTLERMVRDGKRFACLTCYDATTARLLQNAGVPVLLVGDTAAEVILGYPSTIHAPLDFLITITAAVKRGAPKCLVIGDMPFMSYQPDRAGALRNAGRFMTEGLADIVKIEVDRSFLPLVEEMSRIGIPVVAHLGSRPQRSKYQGGYRSSGRTAQEAHQIIADARAMEDAGARMILLEAMPAEVSERVAQRAGVPVIGCGAGPACHGQIVVLQDLLGMTTWQPAFATPIADLGQQITSAAEQWITRVQRGDLGDHPYHMQEGEAERL